MMILSSDSIIELINIVRNEAINYTNKRKNENLGSLMISNNRIDQIDEEMDSLEHIIRRRINQCTSQELSTWTEQIISIRSRINCIKSNDRNHDQNIRPRVSRGFENHNDDNKDNIENHKYEHSEDQDSDSDRLSDSNCDVNIQHNLNDQLQNLPRIVKKTDLKALDVIDGECFTIT